MAMDKQIKTVIQRGNKVIVYGERNQILFNLSVVTSRGDALHGYTSGSASIRKLGRTYTYNSEGRLIGTA